MSDIKTIGIVTSGNDAPGMNSAIRAVTRSAIYNGLRVKAVYRGYKGLIDGDIVEFKTQNVSNIIQQGGTILKSSASKEFLSSDGRQKAFENIQREEIDALVVIGGDGSIHGARVFAQEFDFPCIAIPATIDNNLCGTDTTIGYDTALNTIMQTVDKIRDTATSHERLFFVEVMGDEAGFLCLNGAIASGCEEAIIPSVDIEEDQLTTFIQNGFRKAKNSSIVLVAANEKNGGAMHYADFVKLEGKDGLRLNQTMKTSAQLEQELGLKIQGIFYGVEDLFMWKWRAGFDTQNWGGYGAMSYTNNYRWMRLAEVYLLAAEAYVQSNNGKATEYLNCVRRRAGEPDLASCTLADIQIEKRCELCGEGVRYQDIQRWGIAKDLLAKQGEKIPSTGPDGVIWDTKSNNDPSKYGYKTGKHEFLPIPFKEIKMNENIKQNPGWD